MLKRYLVNEKSYVLRGTMYDDTISLSLTHEERHFNNETTLYRAKMKNNFLLKLFGYTPEKRLQNKVKKALTIMNKHAYKGDELVQALKSIEETIDLDKHMNL